MELAAKNLEFEKAALLRDRMTELRRSLDDIDLEIEHWIKRKK